MSHPDELPESNIVEQHVPCPSCGSHDALCRYDDGHGYCFSCQKYFPPEGGPQAAKERTPVEPTVTGLIEIGRPMALPKRCLSEEACAKWQYHVGHYNGKPVQIANYCDLSGRLVAQKLRFADKSFLFLGDTKAAGLYGMNLWKDGGRKVVITEGEIDAVTVSQVQELKWPVVSVPNGAAGAKKAIAKCLDWLEKFDEVVFMFDMDDPGRKASIECALLLSPGKARIATLAMKDPNELLKAGRGGEIVKAIWDAKTYRPDGIVSGTDLWDVVSREDTVISLPYPWQGLNELTLGIRQGEITTVTAGSGIGKSQLCREIAHWLITKHGQGLGIIALEENTRKTAMGLMSIEVSRPLHKDPKAVSEADLRKAFDATVGNGKVYLYDHFGSTEAENLMHRIRYLVKGCGCRWIILDHISIVVSGMEDGDERRLIDNTMTHLRTLVQELGCGMILVTHLKRPEGKGHEDGAQTSLSQLRGSAAIGQLSDMVIGLERNQQDPKNKHLTVVRVLKNRFSGDTGVACYLQYTPETGRLSETEPAFDDEAPAPDDGDKGF